MIGAMATSYLSKNKARTAKSKVSAKVKSPADSKPATPASRKSVAKPTSPKPAPARAVPKQSPLKGMPVEQWVKEKTNGWQTEAAVRLIGIVREAAPEATASIKWGQPVFEANGPFAYFRPAKAHLTFGFWRGTEIADPKKLLSGDGDRMAHMKLTSPAQIDAAALSAMIRDAVRLNREHGNPTLRAKR